MVEWKLSAMKPTANQKQEQTMVSLKMKTGGRKDCVDLWATIKALKTTGSSIETRLLSVRTYRTDLQEYLASF